MAPEWECFPFWVRIAEEVIADNCSVERVVVEFGAPSDLAAAIDG
ncbi:hypothetical protein [Saccharothrix xinjiangensis]|uniref:Uncharacterized protein n=1 Tax=Saccharothrix xinjiangensis TaxID=204798 RepID=A0ABV9XUP4_9PSEU